MSLAEVESIMAHRVDSDKSSMLALAEIVPPRNECIDIYESTIEQFRHFFKAVEPQRSSEMQTPWITLKKEVDYDLYGEGFIQGRVKTFDIVHRSEVVPFNEAKRFEVTFNFDNERGIVPLPTGAWSTRGVNLLVVSFDMNKKHPKGYYDPMIPNLIDYDLLSVNYGKIKRELSERSNRALGALDELVQAAQNPDLNPTIATQVQAYYASPSFPKIEN